MFLKHIFVLLIGVHSIVGQPVEVNTTSGRVVGHTVNVLGKTVNEFIGIPFAEPPIGDLRFAKPRPIASPLPVSNHYTDRTRRNYTKTDKMRCVKVIK